MSNASNASARRATGPIKKITPREVLLCCTDTATGEAAQPKQIDLQELTAKALTAWFTMDTAQLCMEQAIEEKNIKYECVAFYTQDDSTYCFIMAVTGAVYFGSYMIHGVLHTRFAKR